ncbi:MAG: tetratricopeptide repeat protein [Rhodospirillales bacterium]
MNRQERRRQKKLADAADKPSPQIRARLTAGVRAYREGRFSDAEEAFIKVLDERPREVEALHLLGLIEYRTGRLDQAADHLVAASMVDGEDPAIHANLAAVLNLCGRGAEAEAASRHVLELRPDNAEAYNNLAVAMELQDRIDEAEACGKRAIELDPHHLEAHINLGNLYFRKGTWGDAADVYQRAAEIDPTNPMAPGNLGVVLRRMGDLAGAEEYCRRALQLKPDYPEGFNALGNVFMAQGDIAGALEAFRAALTHRDGYLEARANLAGALFKSGDLDAAEDAYRDTVARFDRFAGAWSGLGTVLLTKGDTAGAEEAFLRAVEAHQGLGDAWVNLAAAGALTEDHERQLSELLTEASENDQTAQLLFALGAAQDRRGDAAAAFATFTQANTMRRRLLEGAGQGFDADRLDQWTDAIIGGLSRDALAKAAGWGDSSATPVLVIGMPRSGTTLVEQIISSHAQGSGAGELDALSRLLPDFPDDVVDLDAERTAGLAADYLKRLTAGRAEAARIVDKTPLNIFYLGLAQILMPGTRVIHCRRDAADIALSCYFTNFVQGLAWSTDLGDIARMQAAQDRVMAHWRATLDLPILEVKYEDLVNDQEGQSRAMIDFLGLDWDPACLDFHNSGNAVLTASNWQVRRPLYKSAVGRAEAYGAFLASPS